MAYGRTQHRNAPLTLVGAPPYGGVRFGSGMDNCHDGGTVPG